MDSLVNIIIVNWNGKVLLSDCLESLRKQTIKPFGITMVDNGSTDGSVELVRKEYPEVDIITLDKNTGFAVANNIAIKKSPTKYIALLNNDTKAHPSWLENLVQAMESNHEIGFACSKMLYHNNPYVIDRAGDFYTTAGTALLRGRGMPSGSFKEKELVFGACAGAVIYRKEMLDDIGLFDEDFFLLYEDVELSFRAQLLGYKCLYVPNAIVYHKVGSTIGHDSSLSIYYSHRNLEWTYIKCLPLSIIFRTIIQHLIYILGCLMYFIFIGQAKPFIRAKYDAIKKLRYFLKKRKEILNKKRVEDKYIWNLLKTEKFTSRILRRFKKLSFSSINHILIDYTQIPVNKVGVGVYATNLIKEITNLPKTNKYSILVQDDEYSLDVMEQENLTLIKVKSMFFRYIFFRVFLEQFYIPLLVLKNKIDVIHSLHYSFPLLIFHSKRIVTIPDLTFLNFPKFHIFVKRYYFKAFIRLASKLADQIICISYSTKKDFLSISNIKETKVNVVHLAKPEWDNSLFVDKHNTAVKNKFNIQDEYLLFVGMIEPRKNLRKLVLAFNRLHQDYNRYQLVIAGPKGWHYKPLYQLIDTLNCKRKILFTGYIDDDEKAILMKYAKIFVYPSLYEGFGLPVLEAMSLGVPTVTSNVSSMPEISGDAAILINPESVDELYDAIIRLINDEDFYNSLKKKSILQAKKFSWKETAKKTVEIYENIYNAK